MEELKPKYKKYTAYKNSGVECLPAGEAGLGEIPEEWEVMRLGTKFVERKTNSI